MKNMLGNNRWIVVLGLVILLVSISVSSIITLNRESVAEHKAGGRLRIPERTYEDGCSGCYAKFNDALDNVIAKRAAYNKCLADKAANNGYGDCSSQAAALASANSKLFSANADLGGCMSNTRPDC